MERRLAAVLISDVVDYTKLMEIDTEGTVSAWSKARDEFIEPSILAHKGRVVKFTGDGFLAEFKTVQDALQCAIDLQIDLSSSSLKFRMGINLGDIIDDGKDIHGEGINIAARLETIAQPGTICISGDVFNQVRHRIDVEYQDLGPQEVKNVSEPVMAYMVRVEDKALEKTQVDGDDKEKLSIAVLPFDNMSADPEQEFFTDGIVEDIITELSFLKDIKVIARNSSFAYKGQSPDIRKVGIELDVNHVLEGSVRKAGNMVRITAQLIVTHDNSHRWAKRYDGNLENIFELQAEISKNIAEELNLEFFESAKIAVGNDALKKKQAFDISRRGRQVTMPPTPSNMAKAKIFYNQAIEIDPNCALAYAGIGHAEALLAWYNQPEGETKRSLLKSARDFAEKAQALDPKLALPYLSNLVILMQENRILEAKEYSVKALQHCPNDPLTHQCLGMISIRLEDYQSALQAINKTIELDPLHLPTYFVLFVCHYAMGDFASTIDVVKKHFVDSDMLLELPPNDICILIGAHVKEGKIERARELANLFKTNFPDYNSTKIKGGLILLPDHMQDDLLLTVAQVGLN